MKNPTVSWRKSGVVAAFLSDTPSVHLAFDPWMSLEREWPEKAHVEGAIKIYNYEGMADVVERHPEAECLVRGVGFGVRRLGPGAMRALAESEIPTIEAKIAELDREIDKMEARWPLVPGTLLPTAEHVEKRTEEWDVLLWWAFLHRDGHPELQRRLARRGVLYSLSYRPVPLVGEPWKANHATVYVSAWVSPPGHLADPLEEALAFWRART